MKKTLLSCLFFLIATLVNAQVVLGGGTTQGGYMPVDVNYGYNYSQQIFAKTEINASAAGNITGVKFYLPNNADISKTVDWVVYIGHTTKTTFSSNTDWIPLANMTQVFSGAVNVVGSEVTVNFSSPFAYNNTDNLVIAVDENTADFTASSNRFYTYTGPSNSGIAYRSDTTNPDPASPPSGTRGTIKSITGLLGLSSAAIPACPAVTAPAASATNVAVAPAITWTASNYASSYKLSIGTTPGGTDVMNMVDVGNVTSYTPAGFLNFNTQYYYTVYAVNVLGTSTGCAERSFTTTSTLACPTVSAPTSAVVGTSTKPTFSWASVTGATGYRLSIGTSAGANNVLANFDLGNILLYTLTTAQQLNPSTQYFYTITAYNGNVASTGCTERNFTTSAAVPPANDDCANATSLTVNPSLTCTATTPGNTLGASYSMAATPCSGNPGDDVWYSFTATASSHLVTLSNIVSTGVSSDTDMYFQVLGGSCGNLTSILCSDADINMVTGLTPGQTYYVRVYTYSSNANTNASFNICISTPPPPPANDECSNAVTVAVNADMNCGSVTSGNTSGATNSSVPVGTCSGTPDDDVWYKFVATGTKHTIWLKNVVSVGTSASTSLYAQVFSGACGTLTSTTCITSNTTYTVLSNLNAGDTYYVRVYNSNANSGASLYANSFDLCIGTLPAAPANDECANAVPLTVNPDMNCGSVAAGTTLSATNSSVPVGTCTGNPDDDVWYSFTATGTAHTIWLKNVVSVGSSSSTSLYAQVFTGGCGALVNKTCITSNTNYTSLTGLTAGETYYVRVYNSNANTATTVYANTFNICIGTLPPPPANDDCANATSLTVSNTGTCSSPVIGSTFSATQSTGTTPTCAASGINDDVWYSFTAAAATQLVTVNYTDNATATQVYSGSCGSFTAIACTDGGFGNSNVLLTTLTAGQVYYVRVYSSSSTAATASSFSICVTTPVAPANDTCDTAIAIPCGGTVEGNNALATNETLPSSTCGGTTTTASYKGVWYTVNAKATGPITVSACGAEFDSYLRVYSGSCAALTCVSNNSGVGFADGGCPGTNLNDSSTLTFNATAGTTYYVLLTGYTAARFGKYTISVTQDCSTMGTSEVNKEDKLKAYPNPFAETLTISDISKVKSVAIIDLSGKLVKTFDSPSATLQLGDLKQGMYLVTLHMKDGSKQIIKAIKK
ncbi:T9SS type A sorting domain-containing protein [Chryseobacterium angstadtii]|uniref:T9SS type A sorting domain-containing protein n=1 Tax=Chryseobacterium angstadtii TaxID=558151 RepID=UPI000A037E7A|nr:T9SS type A sorting domain-containing protein [Chryseobacterium angstadtii]